MDPYIKCFRPDPVVIQWLSRQILTKTGSHYLFLSFSC